MGNIPFSGTGNSNAAKDMESMVKIIERLFNANNLATKSWKSLDGMIAKDTRSVQAFTNSFLTLIDRSKIAKISINDIFKKVETAASKAGRTKAPLTNVFDQTTDAIYKEITALDKLLKKREDLSKFGDVLLKKPSMTPGKMPKAMITPNTIPIKQSSTLINPTISSLQNQLAWQNKIKQSKNVEDKEYSSYGYDTPTGESKKMKLPFLSGLRGKIALRKIQSASASEFAKPPTNPFISKFQAKSGAKGFGLGTGITPFVSKKIENIKEYLGDKGIMGGGKAQALGAIAGLGAKGTLKGASKIAGAGLSATGKGVAMFAKAGAGLAKKGVQKSLGMFTTMGKVLKSGLVAGAAGAIVGMFRSMSPLGAISSTIGKSFGALSSVMSAQLAPALASLTTTILTPENIQLFIKLGQAFVPLVKSVADLLNSILTGGAFEGIVTGIITVMGSLFDIFNDPNLQTSLGLLITSLSDLAVNFFSFLADMMPSLTPILISIAGLFGTIASIFSDPAFQAALGGFISTLAALITNLVNIASELLTELQPYFIIFLDLLSQMLGLFNDPAVKDAIKQVVENLVIMAVNFIQAIATILPVLMPLLLPLITWLSDLGVFISNLVVGLATFISDNAAFINSVFNGIIEFINGIITGINTVFGTNIPTIDVGVQSENTGSETPSGGGGPVPMLASQGLITGTGIAKVHAGEMVVKSELIREVVREAMSVTNNFYGQVGPNERREFSRNMQEIWGE